MNDFSPTGPKVLDATRRRRLVITAMLVSTFMSAAEVTVISTAMPTIVSRLGGFDLFTWAFGIYLLGQAITTPIYGRLADLYGRRVVYLGSTTLFLLGSLLCGFAWSMPALIVFRGIQGLGGGGLLPLATTIIGDVCDPKDRPRVLGYTSGIWGIAAIAGPLIGSLCVGTIGWPWVFWLNLPIGAVTIMLVARYFAEPPRTARKAAWTWPAAPCSRAEWAPEWRRWCSGRRSAAGRWPRYGSRQPCSSGPSPCGSVAPRCRCWRRICSAAR